MAFVARIGLRAKYIGKIGADDLGLFSLESLKAENIDISSVVIQPGARNQYAFIIIDQNSGERTILWDRDQKLDFQEGELRKEAVCSGRILHLDGHDRSALLAAVWAREEGIPVVMDLDKIVPRCDELIANADFVITNAAFPSEFSGISDPEKALLEMRRCCRGLLAATLGARGAIVVLGDECMQFPAFKVRTVDTTGAGDVFHGGFIYGLLQNWTLERTMTFANAAAALSCTRLGARAGIPSFQEILQLIDSR